MSDPRRLLEEGANDLSDLERDMLRAWDAERPPSSAKAKTLAIVGLGVGAAIATAAGASLAPKAVTSLAIAKWVAAGLVALTIAAGTFAYVRRAPAIAPPPSDAIDAPRQSTTTHAPPPSEVAAPSAPPELTTNSAPPPVATTTGAPRAPHPRAPAPEGSGALGDQVDAIDHARRALAGGDAPRAIALLDAYDHDYPRGALAQEAQVLRIETLLAQGDREAARRVGQRFLSAYPTSPHASRVRALLAEPSTSP